MPIRYLNNFYPINSTEPSFNSTVGATSAFFALESTNVREWQGPSGRGVRVASKAADDFSIVFGTSDIIATSSGGILILGGTVETYSVQPRWTHVAVVSSTDVDVNFCLGYGQ